MKQPLILLSLLIAAPASGAKLMKDVPAALQGCRTETDFIYPRFKQELSRAVLEKHLEGGVKQLGYDMFAHKATLNALIDLVQKSGDAAKELSSARIACKETPVQSDDPARLGLFVAGGYVCQQRLSDTEIAASAGKALAACRKIAAWFAEKHKNSLNFRVECPPPRIRQETPNCKEVARVAPEKARDCNASRLAGVTRIDAWPSFLLTNKSHEPHARERRCSALKACVAGLKPLSPQVEEDLAVRSNLYCNTYESTGLAGVASALRARGQKFLLTPLALPSEEENRSPVNSSQAPAGSAE